MAVNPPTGDDAEELTPAEEKKFTKFLGKFLAEDDAPEPTRTQQAPAQQSGGNIDIAGEINRALDARDAAAKAKTEQAAKDAELETLRKRPVAKVRAWFSPLFSDE